MYWRWLRAAGLVQLPQDARQPVADACRRWFSSWSYIMALSWMFSSPPSSVIRGHTISLAPLDPVEVAHRRLAVPVDHVHQPDVLGQHGVECAELAAAEDQLRSELGRRDNGP